MRPMSSLALLAGFALVGQGSPEKPEPARPAVPVVKDATVLFHAGHQKSPLNVVGEAPAPVTSLERGLPYVQKASRQPILGMSESKEWFFYATFVGRDKRIFISGYAIKRGGRQIIPWNGW